MISTIPLPGPCQAVIFDFDGVLLESVQLKTAAFRRLYADHGDAIADQAAAHYRATGGLSRLRQIAQCHRNLLGRDPDDAEVLAWAERFARDVEEGVTNGDWVPGANAFLERFCGELACFIVSGTPDAELKRIVARREMGGCFRAVHGTPPDKTTHIRAILAEGSFDPEAVVMVGDGIVDRQSAIAAGIPFLGRIHRDGLDPFPPGAPTIPDLTHLAPALGLGPF